MNVVEAELSHLYFLYNNIEDINTTIDNADVSIRRGKNDRRLYVEIRGKKENHLRKLFFEIHSLMFLYLGGFPKIEKIIINSKIVDTSQLVAKFNTCKEYYKEGLSLCDINNKTINKTVIQNYRKLRQYPIYTLQNLVSEQYASVVMVHKVTLLLHAMEGVMDSDLLDKTHNELKAKWNTKKSIREIKVASYYMCKNYFFNYHRKYKFDILKLLKVSRKRFLDIIADTRDWYSHYLEDKDKKNRLKKGPEMAIYFNIICYVVRTYLIDQIKIKYDEERLIEYYFTLHDWILDIQEKKGQLKSKAYKMNEEFSKIRDRI